MRFVVCDNKTLTFYEDGMMVIATNYWTDGGRGTRKINGRKGKTTCNKKRDVDSQEEERQE